jgi:uroporphyrinogen decarboxylase
MMSMNKRQRLFAAVRGEEVDRPPVTAWVHFLSDHLDGSQVAELHRLFMEAYDWDILKVMNDYRYPVPAGVTTLDDVQCLERYQKLAMTEPCFANQLACLERLRERFGDQVPMFETIFSPYQQIERTVGFDQAPNMLRHGQATIAALETVTETMCDYVQAVKARGIEGIFLAIDSAVPSNLPRGVTDEQHERFQKPFAIRVLRAAEGMVRVLHVHGTHLDMRRIADYPYEVLNLSDRLPGNPSLATLRGITDKCIMGGINETRLSRSLPELRKEIDDAIAQAGRRKFILSPGCTIPSSASARSLSFLREYSRTV